jgi:hypothetical protein
MSVSEQKKCGVSIGGVDCYPKPVVDEKESARVSKQKVSDVKKSGTAKRQAQEVYQKHGSRSGNRDSLPGETRVAVPVGAKKAKKDVNQRSILDMLSISNKQISDSTASSIQQSTTGTGIQSATVANRSVASKEGNTCNQLTLSDIFRAGKEHASGDDWNCHACTFLNAKSRALACDMCATVRRV